MHLQCTPALAPQFSPFFACFRRFSALARPVLYCSCGGRKSGPRTTKTTNTTEAMNNKNANNKSESNTSLIRRNLNWNTATPGWFLVLCVISVNIGLFA
jgi:hypothetical protein